jgi:hypothetical protein
MDADGSAAKAGLGGDGEGVLLCGAFVAVVADILLFLAGKVDVGDGVVKFHFVIVY